MNKKEEFKTFIKNNTEFIEAVKSGKTTWQKLYEIYDLYGEEESAWKSFRVVKETKKESKLSSLGIKDVIKSLKNIDVDSLQESLSSIQKAAGFLEELTSKTSADRKEKKDRKKKETTIERFFDD